MLKNSKYELFAQGLAKGINQTESALQAKLVTAKSTDRYAKACKLAKRPEIKKRVAELVLRADMSISKDIKITREWLRAELIINVHAARDAGNYGASNKALEMLGNNAGGDCSFVQRQEITVWDGDLSTLSDDQVERMTQQFERLAFGADVARLHSEKRRVLKAAGSEVIEMVQTEPAKFEQETPMEDPLA